MRVKVFSVPKYEKNEDKWHIPAPNQFATAGDDVFDETKPIVLCDGASESFASSLWAEILCQNFHRQENFSDAWLNERINEYERNINPANLNWSRQMAYERGSFATFLSALFRDGKCLLNAIGDSVAFTVNKTVGSVLQSYPYDQPNDFLQHPLLFSTKPELNIKIGPAFQGELQNLAEATHVLLLTDALAHWLMKRRDEPDKVKGLLALSSQNEFQTFVLQERKNDLRFDDTTMIRISLADNLPVVATPNLLPAREN